MNANWHAAWILDCQMEGSVCGLADNLSTSDTYPWLLTEFAFFFRNLSVEMETNTYVEEILRNAYLVYGRIFLNSSRDLILSPPFDTTWKAGCVSVITKGVLKRLLREVFIT